MPYLLSGRGDIAKKTITVSFILCSVTMPTIVLLSIYCEWVFNYWIGPQSHNTILTAQIILAGTAFQTSAAPLYYALLSLNKIDEMLRISMVVLICVLTGTFISAFWFGMVAVSDVWAISNIFTFLICYYMLTKSLADPHLMIKAFVLILPLTALPVLPILYL